MEPGSGLPQRRAGGGGLDLGAGSAAGSPALSGGQSRRRKQPPRPADFKLQVIIIGSRGVGKTSLMERFTDDTFCEACKSTVGKGAQPVPSRGRGRFSPRCPQTQPWERGARCGGRPSPAPVSPFPKRGPAPRLPGIPSQTFPFSGTRGSPRPLPLPGQDCGLGLSGWVSRLRES